MVVIEIWCKQDLESELLIHRCVLKALLITCIAQHMVAWPGGASENEQRQLLTHASRAAGLPCCCCCCCCRCLLLVMLSAVLLPALFTRMLSALLHRVLLLIAACAAAGVTVATLSLLLLLLPPSSAGWESTALLTPTLSRCRRSPLHFVAVCRPVLRRKCTGHTNIVQLIEVFLTPRYLVRCACCAVLRMLCLLCCICRAWPLKLCQGHLACCTAPCCAPALQAAEAFAAEHLPPPCRPLC